MQAMKGDNMVAAVKKNALPSPVPEIACPRCKRAMRLATIEPMANSDDNRMSFECDCGFECRMPEAAAPQASLQGR